jgi:hypothetical protein
MMHLSDLPTGGPAEGHMLTSLRVLTGVRGIVCAAHKSLDGKLHGHTWTVKAWWLNTPDAVEKQAELTSYLSIFDHQTLGDAERWGEALAQAILMGMHCQKVEVSRDGEGIYASAERP